MLVAYCRGTGVRQGHCLQRVPKTRPHAPHGHSRVSLSVPLTARPPGCVGCALRRSPRIMTASWPHHGRLLAPAAGYVLRAMQLIFRCLNRDLGRPNANNDTLAAALRDELMPVRSWCLKHLPGSKGQMKVRRAPSSASNSAITLRRQHARSARAAGRH